jgi:xanthine dehydrogenase small subunit
MLLLDLVRYEEHLTGTKIGCREGDCGACTVLIGELRGDRVVYRPATSCLTALGNVHRKHVVTIEGLNGEGLNYLQQAIHEEGATQCGFCTPGFIISMAGFCLAGKMPTQAGALAAIDGNICRCTGYKSIERALSKVTRLLEDRQGSDPVAFAITHNILPAWFADIPRRLGALWLEPNGVLRQGKGGRFLGGGTDLYVQQHAGMIAADLEFLAGRKDLNRIEEEDGEGVIGGAVTVSDLQESSIIRRAFPNFDAYVRLMASTPVRNIATIAGNLVNASPIGDFTIFFLALDTRLILSNGQSRRSVLLRKFYRGYKLLDKEPDEFIESIRFRLPDRDELFNFEKVSKRTHLDIASVNTAIRLRLTKDGRIAEGQISAGGVGPVPAYLEGASALLAGERPDPALINRVIGSAQEETAPISDVRGTAGYKRLLLGQLIKAHFLTLFPQLTVEELL